jgi:hypothetical protein
VAWQRRGFLVTRCAASFCSTCSLRNCFSLALHRRPLWQSSLEETKATTAFDPDGSGFLIFGEGCSSRF